MAKKEERTLPTKAPENATPPLSPRSPAVCFGQWFLSESQSQEIRTLAKLEQSFRERDAEHGDQVAHE